MIQKMRASNRPLYAQTVDALYTLIGEGAFPVGTLLPSEEALASQLGVSRSTLREAISYLEMGGLLVRRQGIGTYVAAAPGAQVRGGLERLHSFSTLAELAGKRAETVERQVSIVTADQRAAEALRVAEGSELVRVQTVEALDGCRTAYLDSQILPEYVDFDALHAASGSLLDYLIDYTNLPLAHALSVLRAMDADAELATHLQVQLGQSLLHLAETLFTDSGKPVAMSLNYFLTHCFSFTIDRRIERPWARGGSRPHVR